MRLAPGSAPVPKRPVIGDPLAVERHPPHRPGGRPDARALPLDPLILALGRATRRIQAAQQQAEGPVGQQA